MEAPWTGLVLVATLASPGAWGRDVDYDFVFCGHARNTLLEAGAEIVAFGIEEWGTVASSTTKDWEKATSHCVGHMRILAGKRVGKGLCKWFTLAGDTAVGEWEVPETGDNTFRWLSGTGGLKGIGTTKSSFSFLGNGKAVEPNTSQGCRHDWGSYTLP